MQWKPVITALVVVGILLLLAVVVEVLVSWRTRNIYRMMFSSNDVPAVVSDPPVAVRYNTANGDKLVDNGVLSPVPLVGRAVFVVCTLLRFPRTPADPPVILLTLDGDILLRVDPPDTLTGDPLPRLGTHVRLADGTLLRSPYTQHTGLVATSGRRVWGFQYTQSGADVRVKHIPVGGLCASGAEVSDDMVAPGKTMRGGQQRLLVGAATDVEFHEIAVYQTALTDAELQSVYRGLVAKWM